MRFSTCAFSLPSSSSSCCHSSRRRWYSAWAGGESRLGLVLAHHLLEAGRERRGDVAEHLAAELQGDERRAEPAGARRSGTRGSRASPWPRARCPRVTPAMHLCRGERRSAAPASCGFISCCELRVEVLDLHARCARVCSDSSASSSSTCRTCFLRTSRTASSSGRLVRGAQRGERLGVLALEHPQRHARRSCGSPRPARTARASRKRKR